jgi:D-beta-D-heptose 7-phosphate kinase/D-beta-D-heptose 1-phosphate adenosyltransferase
MGLIQEFLARNRQKKLNIHCLGDALIDEYYAVQVSRISPEFPMPIMKSEGLNFELRPGGAANVAHQLRNFNVSTDLFCFFDEYAAAVFGRNDLRQKAIKCTPCTLPIKRRYLDGKIQIIRHDIEFPLCGLDEHLIHCFWKHLRDTIGLLPKPDVAILSDYNKGFFSDEDFRLSDLYSGVKTIVDPKKGPLKKWTGCTVFKPNAKEALELTGRTRWQEQARQLQTELECEAVVITFGGEKVVGIQRDDYFHFVPRKSVEVESVVGAGDCFAAIFSVAFGHGFSVPEAAEIAWNAGSVYVQNAMNRPMVPAEIAPDKIVAPEDLTKRDFTLIFTNGVFDMGLTGAHVKYLKEAKYQGEKLVVALNSDDSVTRLKGVGRPVMPLEERMQILASLDCVDFVTSFEEDTPLEIIKKIKPQMIVKGGDYQPEDVVGHGIVPVMVTPRHKSTSTTDKIKACNHTDCNHT